MSYNKIIIMGNLGRDPQLTHSPQGTAICTFTIASNERRRDKAGNWYDHTTWFRATVWGKPGEKAARLLRKGFLTTVIGQVREEKWTDREGKERTSLEVDHAEVQYIDMVQEEDQGGAPQQQAGGGAPQGGGGRKPGDIEDDEIPF